MEKASILGRLWHYLSSACAKVDLKDQPSFVLTGDSGYPFLVISRVSGSQSDMQRPTDFAW